jgi:hypothetical protein
MRLLFLTSRLPYPPDRGDKRRTNQFLKLFAGEHSVTLVSFFAEERERLLAEELRPYCEAMHLIHLPLRRSVLNVALNFWRDLPLQALYYRSPQMERVLSDLLSQQTFDLAYVHLFRMAPYLIGEQQLYRNLTNRLFGAQSIESKSLGSHALSSGLPPNLTKYGS